ncbi:hypothetical protein DEU56DRAFT_159519 [Suillus clintonianus]|uniref:uncharacterized protein n=1 Tax=Suillus clintonianus TaxID=1904413 RepID=UPI001B87ECF2|nr:uncharacterized protein DEU56DRAFT_159519 [Suillus clintonianus]KAG2117728.1 hypothetical protein DEU56DRAFT_159519 [Suillus clintonianus]
MTSTKISRLVLCSRLSPRSISMTALDLHNSLFTSDKRFVNANVSATPTPTPMTRPRPRILSLTTVQEHDPTSPTFNSPTFHDLLSRQPLHPDGPRHWDLGLDLTGDPLTAAECKSLKGRITKSKLRRLQWISVVFEVVLGLWSIYCTIRYSLAFQTSFKSSVRTLALVSCVASGISVAGVVVTLFMPLLPKNGFVRAARMISRGCFVVLIFATAIANLVFVLIWRPVDRCGWDLDVSWSSSLTVDSSSPHCRTASLAAWTIIASLRVIATLIMILLYLYFLRAYFEARHPSRYARGMYYPPLMASEDVVHSPVSTIDSPVSTIDPSSSRTHFNKLIPSQAALGRSSSTLALTNSSITLAPSLSPSHSQNTPATSSNPASPTSNPIWRNWTNLRLSIKDRRANYQRHNSLSDTPTPRTLRRQNRISSEHILRNADTLPGAWDPEECTEVYAVGLGASSRVVTDLDHFACVGELGDACPRVEHRPVSVGPLMSESGSRDCDSVYSYGYGASEPAYPYLEIYNPPPSIAQNHNYNPPPPAHVNGIQPRSSAAVTARADTIEPASPLTTIDDFEEDELIPVMGGFVRRMATIESFGSREAALSMARSRFSRISETPASPRSSLGWTPSIASTLSKNASLGTAYYSVSSDLGMGGSSIKVNERGELETNMTSPPSYSRYHYTRDANRTTLSVPS